MFRSTELAMKGQNIDVASSPSFPLLISELEDGISKAGTADNLFETIGREAFVELLRNTCPSLFNAIEITKEELDTGKGFTVLTNTGVDTLQPELAKAVSITIGAQYGTPTRTDKSLSRIVWAIHNDDESTLQKTFSQTMNEVSFHTDTQYFEKPEQYFGLFCVTADVQGKGTNGLIDVRTIIDSIRSKWGEGAISALKKPFPFKVPSVFTEHASDEDTEITLAPIIGSDGSVRYRLDTLMKALNIPGVTIADDQLEAIKLFEDEIASAEPIQHHLIAGEAIIINNHRMLHSRSEFDNKNRLLYRVRMSTEDDEE